MCERVCTGSEYEKERCDVEKMGCEGCGYYKKKGEKNEQKISKYSKNKGD